MVMQQSPIRKRLKCTCVYWGWSIFTEKCTSAVASSAIKLVAFLASKMERTIDGLRYCCDIQ